MDVVRRCLAFFILLSIAERSVAQDLNGKVIYVSRSQVVVLKFGSTIKNFTYDEESIRNLFLTKQLGEKNLSILSVAENFKPAYLHIIEGKNTHLFILKYKVTLDENERLDRDYSSRSKLREAVEELERQRLAGTQADAAPAPVDSATVRKQAQPVDTKAPAPVLPAEHKNEKAADAQKPANQPATESQNRYNRVIATADNMYDAAMYEDARKEYVNARAMMPGQPYPAQKIKLIDSIFAKRKNDLLKMKQDSVRAVNAVKTRQDSINRQYTLAMQCGAAAVKKKDYIAAKDCFQKAAAIKPGESEPGTQLALVNKKLEEIALDEKYVLFMHKGDSLSRTVKDYRGARRFYDSARMTKPGEQLPPKQLRAVDRLILVQDSTVKEQEEERVRTAKFNQIAGIYRVADTARLERKYAEAYKSYREFLAGINIQQKDKYLPSQRYCIDRALENIQTLEPYFQKMLDDSTRKARVEDSLRNTNQGGRRRRRGN